MSSKPTTFFDQVTAYAANANPSWLIGGIGSLLLLCAFALITMGAFVGREPTPVSSDDEIVIEADAAEEMTNLAEQPDRQNIEPVTDTSPDDESATREVSAESGDSATEGEAVIAAPEISPLTFALDTTAQGEPLEPSFSFEAGVTQIHALFDYANLTPNNIWAQVWYHDGNEVVSTSQPWLEAEQGVYDYRIDAGGEPLDSGQWALEFYIDGELLTAGSFMIEDSEALSTTAELPSLDDLPRIYQLAYTKWDGEKHNLFIGDTNGSREQFILRGGAGPSWSKDGGYLFFYGEEGVDQQVINGALYPLPGVSNGVIRLDVSPVPTRFDQMQLMQGHGWNDGTARWANVAPDGAMIAYDGDRGGGRRIYFLGTAANQQFRYEIIGEQADWSPDGQKIVYRSGRNNQVGIWISNRDDSGHTRITPEGSDSFPAWSPDGQTIAFSRDAGGNVDIYSVNVDGSNLKRLTDTPGHDTLPAFAPNGDIIFRSARSGTWEIWKMKGDGSDQNRIIGNAPVGPEWSFSRLGVLR